MWLTSIVSLWLRDLQLARTGHRRYEPDRSGRRCRWPVGGESRLADVTGRRNSTRRTTLFALVTAGVVTLSGCAGWFGDDSGEQEIPADPPNVAKPEGRGDARCDGAVIAYVGSINSGTTRFGGNILRGAELAVRRHNSANKRCVVELKEYETEGIAEKATGIARLVVAADEIIGVVGLPHSSEATAAGEVFARGGLVQITPSATGNALAGNGWKTFFRGVGNDTVQATAAAKLLAKDLRKKKVCVVHDESGSATAQADAVKKALGDKVACDERVKIGQTEFAEVAKKIEKAGPDAIYYAGNHREAVPFAKELSKAGVEVEFVASDGVMDDEYVSRAGAAAGNSYFICPCVPHEKSPGFTAKYEREFGAVPGAYSVEGYDAATVLLSGIDAGKQVRKSLLSYVGDYNGQGLSKKFAWRKAGELKQPPPVWAYKVAKGKIVRHAEIK